jgi:hypothetical protein
LINLWKPKALEFMAHNTDSDEWLLCLSLDVSKMDQSAFAKQIFEDRLAFANVHIEWYRRKKRQKKVLSIWMRVASLLLVATGGMCPLIANFVAYPMADYGYFLLATGGALLLLDRLLGISSSWIRFMKAAQKIESTVELFRLNLASVISRFESPEPSHRHEILELAKQFTIEIETVIELETKEWEREFSGAVADLEHKSSSARS